MEYSFYPMAVRKPRLLYVDDVDGVRETLSVVLNDNGFDVRLAGTVSEAMAQINNSKFDVLISDLNIENKGGFDVIDLMGKTQPDCIRLVMTGYPTIDNGLRSAVIEVDDYLIKPIDIDGLVKTINQRLLRRRRKNCR
ncbi:MAG: hypothetical protein NVSMB58_36000 [Terriglobales bacterium]